MLKVKRVLGITIILALLIGGAAPFLASISPAAAQTENPYLVRTFVDEDGNEIAVIIVPGKPPEIKAKAVDVPEPNIRWGLILLPGCQPLTGATGAPPPRRLCCLAIMTGLVTAICIPVPPTAECVPWITPHGVRHGGLMNGTVSARSVPRIRGKTDERYGGMLMTTA